MITLQMVAAARETEETDSPEKEQPFFRADRNAQSGLSPGRGAGIFRSASQRPAIATIYT